MKPKAKNKCDFPIVLVFHSSSRTPWNEAFEGMSAYAKESGWKLQLVEEPIDEVQVDRMIQFWRPLGCIAECGCDVHGAFLPQRFRDCPSVFMNPVVAMPKATPSVVQDNRRIGELAARELAGLGLDHFAFLGFSDYPWSRVREEGFLSLMALNGIECEKFLIPHVGVSWNEVVEGREFAEFLLGLPQPCGVFASNDLLAESALNICRKNNIAVPYGLSVIGVDNDKTCCELATPSLTSIDVNFRQQGYRVAEYLGDIVSGKGSIAGRRFFDLFSIVRRQSTRRLAKKSKAIASALEFIRLNACSGISSRDVVVGFAQSRRRAEQRFRQSIGHSILDEINAVRIARAKELLLVPGFPIEGIAAKCGFKSTAHMRVIFSRATGMSLRNWRKVH